MSTIDEIVHVKWKENCKELTAWAWDRLAIKRDRHGLYSHDGSASWTYTPITSEDLAEHFSGHTTVGLGSTSPADECLWVAWDLDNHGDDLPADVNLNYAIILMNRLADMGFRPIVEDSDGRGGIHVWVLFSEPIPASIAYRFARWVAADYADHVDVVECFPKGPTVQHTDAKCGTYLRVPGKHHKRNHWSAFWGDGAWLDPAESVELLLSHDGDNPDLIRELPEERVAPVYVPDPNRDPRPESRSSDIERARKYAGSIDPAIAGNHGHDKSFYAACKIVKGFDLSEADAFDVLSEWNARCEPPWSEPDLRRKISEANKAPGPVGYLRDASRDTGGPAVNGAAPKVAPAPVVVRSFEGIPAADLWSLADQPVEWLVNGVFSVDQPTIFGAKQKAMKTTLLTDLAVALSSGLPWLGLYDVPKSRRVLLITGEASQAAAIRKVKRAAGVRNLRQEDFTTNLRIEALSFPTLPSVADCLAVARVIEAHGIEVVIIDPLYMGLQGLNTANLTEVGPAMRGFMEACRPANLIIAHHVKKTASFDDAPNLEDLSQAGIAEFAGNYWLMGRMREYTGDSMHELAIRFGGRDEQFGLLKMEFNEADWTCRVASLIDHREDLKARKDNERVNEFTDKVLKELKRYPAGISEAKLAAALGTRTERSPFQTALELLEAREAITCLPEFKPERSKACKGWILTDDALTYDTRHRSPSSVS